jgi:hypothetical protein
MLTQLNLVVEMFVLYALKRLRLQLHYPWMGNHSFYASSLDGHVCESAQNLRAQCGQHR